MRFCTSEEGEPAALSARLAAVDDTALGGVLVRAQAAVTADAASLKLGFRCAGFT